MTIFSAEQLFSDDQAITASAVSTNILDLGTAGTPIGAAAALNKDAGKGTPVPILIQVTEVFDNLTSLLIAIETDDNAGFSSARVVHSESVLLAALVVGKQLFIQFLPNGIDERYLRLNYTVTGSNPSTGQITAGISMGNQTNVPS